MSLAQTFQESSFTHSPPNSATFEFPPSPTKDAALPPTKITFPSSSTLTTGLHWHFTHVEYIKVLSGAALVTLSGHSRICTVADEPVKIPRHARHEWMRFDRSSQLLNKEQRNVQELWYGNISKDEISRLQNLDLVVEEWTDPHDGLKEVYFRNLFSTIQEPCFEPSHRFLGPLYKIIQINYVNWELDNYYVLLDLQGWRGGWRRIGEEMIVYGTLLMAAMLAWLLGLRAVNKEYTPRHLIQVWEGDKGASRSDSSESMNVDERFNRKAVRKTE